MSFSYAPQRDGCPYPVHPSRFYFESVMTDLPERLAKLEAEVESLRIMVRELLQDLESRKAYTSTSLH